MSKTIAPLDEKQALGKLWNVETLKHIEIDVFHKQEIPVVRQMTDLAFLHLMRSEICDDVDMRNQVLDSWFANSKLQTIFELKELPDNVLELRIHHDI